jgi:hypothetical protein
MKKIPISHVDVLFSNGIYPIEFLFYYKDAFNTKKIRAALRNLSSAFWPLFGVYQDGMIFADRYREENFHDEEAIFRRSLFGSERASWQSHKRLLKRTIPTKL